MSTKLAQKMILLEKLQILTPLQSIIATGLKSCPKTNKSPNLVILIQTQIPKEENSERY